MEIEHFIPLLWSLKETQTLAPMITRPPIVLPPPLSIQLPGPRPPLCAPVLLNASLSPLRHSHE